MMRWAVRFHEIATVVVKDRQTTGAARACETGADGRGRGSESGLGVVIVRSRRVLARVVVLGVRVRTAEGRSAGLQDGQDEEGEADERGELGQERRRGCGGDRDDEARKGDGGTRAAVAGLAWRGGDEARGLRREAREGA